MGSNDPVSDAQGQGQSRGQGTEANEDAFVADDNLGLYVVCDGAGDEAGGEVASSLAAETIRAFVDRRVADRGRRFRSASFSTSTAVEAIDAAFDAIFSRARQSPALARMATTMTMLLVTAERAIVGHVGDSRLYRATTGQLQQLTVDHPVTEAASGAPLAVGVDAFSLALRPGDVFLLCSDGLRPALSDERWALGVLRRGSVSRAAQRLLQRAAELDPAADATAVVVRVEDETPYTLLQHSRPTAAVSFEDFGFAASASHG